MYSTTIHCLVSGVTKVSRRTKIPPGLVLYRGFGGLRLPDQFYKAPEGGYKGFVEWGFMVMLDCLTLVLPGLNDFPFFRAQRPTRILQFNTLALPLAVHTRLYLRFNQQQSIMVQTFCNTHNFHPRLISFGIPAALWRVKTTKASRQPRMESFPRSVSG